MADATIGSLNQALALALTDKIELEQGATPSNSSKYGELGQVYDLFNTERGTVGTLSVVSGTATADLLSGRQSFFKMTIGANFTLALSNVPAGASFLCVQFTTNSTGGYGVTLPAAFHAMAGSGALVITTPSTVCYLRAYTVDGGVNWYYIIDAGAAIEIVSTITSNTITPTGTTDIVRGFALSAGLTIANPSTTPADGWAMKVELKDDGTARALTWGSKYAAGTSALPTTTVSGKRHALVFFYSMTDDKLYCDGAAVQA